MGSTSRTGLKEIEAPNVDRDIQVSKEFTGSVFAAAQSHNWFNTPCESHLKVAFEGWKTFTCTTDRRVRDRAPSTTHATRNSRRSANPCRRYPKRFWRVPALRCTVATRPPGPGSGDGIPYPGRSGRPGTDDSSPSATFWSGWPRTMTFSNG